MYPRSDRQQPLHIHDHIAATTSNHQLSDTPLSVVIAQSYAEAYPALPWNTPTPWCTELVRRAFANHDEAWTAIYQMVEPIMRRWVRAIRDLDQDEVIQEAFLSFYRFAPQRASLVENDYLGRVLAYLKCCVSTTTISLRRRERRHTESVPLDDSNDHLLCANTTTDSSLSSDLPAQITKLQLTPKEQIILQQRFLEDIPPHKIVTHFPEHFTNVQSVYTVVQNLKQRLRQTSAVQSLYQANFID
ncbi:MAG: hypothetical protein GFH23_1086812n33 [Chloroflexi bacterium AL-N1]|nr:hypothetical protein [Chloroflexi bacterium AL-N1]NOK77376.1 hypothetical protein [Chloroflexi bacterium AL-N5]